MKWEVLSESALKRSIKVIITEEDFQSELEKTFNSIKNYVKIDGFRKGKAPIETVKAMYAEKSLRSTTESLVNKGLLETYKKYDVEPVAAPKIELGEFKAKEGFHFTANFEILPKIENLKFKDLKVPVKKRIFVPKDIDNSLEHLRKTKAKFTDVPSDQPIVMDDLAVVSIKAFDKGKPIDELQANNEVLHLGQNHFVPGFDSELEGLTSGSNKNFQMTLPQDFHPEKLAGKTLDFEVETHSARRMDLPELNDEFVASLGLKDMESLKKIIQQNLEKEFENLFLTEKRNQLFKTLCENNPFELPETLVQAEIQRQKLKTTAELQQKGFNEEQIKDYHSKWESDYKNAAEQGIQLAFLTGEIAKENQLLATDKEIKESIETMALSAGANIKPQEVRNYYESDSAQAQLAFGIVENKVYNFLETLNQFEVEEITEQS